MTVELAAAFPVLIAVAVVAVNALLFFSECGAFDKPFEQVSVAVRGTEGGHVEFEGTLELAPTLFGLGLKQSVFGVSLPSLSHRTAFVVDCYKPGVLV